MRVQKVVCNVCRIESEIDIPVLKDPDFVRNAMELAGWTVCDDEVHVCPSCVSTKLRITVRHGNGDSHIYPLPLSSTVGADIAIGEIKEGLRAWLPETFVEELEFDWIPVKE